MLQTEQVLGYHERYIFVDRNKTFCSILLFVFCNIMFIIVRNMLKGYINVVTMFYDTKNRNIRI